MHDPFTRRRPASARPVRRFTRECRSPRYLAALATALAIIGCRPQEVPRGPGLAPAPATPGPTTRPAPGPPPAQQVLIGEMCPESADGRPAVLPLFVRGLGWSADAEDTRRAIVTRAARQFAVLAWDGRRAGLFSVAGSADVPGPTVDRSIAIGGYAGVSPCEGPLREGGGRDPYPACEERQQGCGLALALVEAVGAQARPFEEDPAPATFGAGGACVAGSGADARLLVDIDGDGRPEAFPVARFLDPVRAPSEDVSSVPHQGERCEPRFALRDVVPPGDPRHFRGADLLGVVDVDRDGRSELVLSYHYAERRTWAVYSASQSASRLELVGEAEPWPR